MENTNMLLLLLLCGVFGLLLVIALVKYLMGYCADLKYVKMEMDRADDWNEYVYWHRELSALRWSIIPGMTPERVKRIRKNMQNLLYRGKYAKKEEKSDGLSGVLLPSVLGICLCAVCLAGSTFAWFTASQSTATQTIHAANYEVSAVVKSGETEVAAENDTYSLKIGKYAVTLTAAGDATTGYGVLDFGNGIKAYTKQITKGASITLTLKINEPAELKITAVWGTYAGDGRISSEYTFGTAPIAEEDAPNDDNNGEQDVTEPAEETTPPTEETTAPETPTEHTVVSGNTLSSIASKYNTTVAKLTAYNNIEDVNKIKIGDIIKIPPDDYVIPEATEITDPPQQTEEATEPTVTEYNEVPTTESEVTAPPETEGNTEATESETIE